MHHVAVDLAAKKSQFCVRKADGEVIEEGRIETSSLFEMFSRLEPSRVVLEACAEAFAVADMAKAAGHEVSIVPSTLAPSLGVGQRGIKTDRKDAQNLSLASCRMEKLPSIHLPSVVARERRVLLTSRSVLVRSRTQVINHVRGWARTRLLKLSKGSSETFPKRVRDICLETPSGLPAHIERVLLVIDSISAQIAESDAELAELTKQDADCQRLMTVPGVGPVTSALFEAAIDDVSRFKSSHAVESYLGLTPGENSSGEKRTRLGITRAGNVRVRTSLVQAAWSAYRNRPGDPMVQWARKLAERKPPQLAVVALARKMAGILFALLRDKTNYDPAHA